MGDNVKQNLKHKLMEENFKDSVQFRKYNNKQFKYHDGKFIHLICDGEELAKGYFGDFDLLNSKYLGEEVIAYWFLPEGRKLEDGFEYVFNGKIVEKDYFRDLRLKLRDYHIDGVSYSFDS